MSARDRFPARSRQEREDAFVRIEAMRVLQDVAWWVAEGWPDVHATSAGCAGAECGWCSDVAVEARSARAVVEAQRRAAAGELSKVTRPRLALGVPLTRGGQS